MAAIAWATIAFLLASEFADWLMWVAPIGALVFGLLWGRFGLLRIAVVWCLLVLISMGVLEYRTDATSLLEEGIREVEFETLGDSMPSGDSFLTWVGMVQPEIDGVLLPGMLTSAEPLSPATRYRSLLDVSAVSDPAERATFWARLVDDSLVLLPPNALEYTVLQLRSRFLESSAGLTPDSRALVAGLAIGERSLLSDSLAAQMRDLSLTHLVAVSGANLAIVAGGVYLVLATLGARLAIRSLAATLAICAYVALVGPEPSVLRAGFMALLVIFGQALGRGNQSLNALSLSVICLVHFDPFLALDFGFALSVSATLGLLAIAPLLFGRLKKRMNVVLAAALAVAIAAQIYTLPILLVLDKRIATYSVIANLLVEPVVAPVTVLGVAAVLVSYFSSPLGAMVSWVASLGTAWVEIVARNLSNLPAVNFAWLPQPFSTLSALLLLLAVTLWLSTGRRKWLLVTATTLIVASAWTASIHIRHQVWPAENWDLAACDVSQGDALVVKSVDRVMLIDTGREPELLLECLGRLRVTHVDLLVLTHFDADHVAAVPVLVQRVSVGQVLVSGFTDDRPLTQIVRAAFVNREIAVATAQAGMSFDFGDGVVKILQPSLTANEASDSNDASVIVAATFDQYSLLSLGDLGEAGQLRLLANAQPAIQSMAKSRLVLKVSHHGSRDQSVELTNLLKPDFALISVGINNPYGHPTETALDNLRTTGAVVLRTDLQGSIALSFRPESEIFVAGKL